MASMDELNPWDSDSEFTISDLLFKNTFIDMQEPKLKKVPRSKSSPDIELLGTPKTGLFEPEEDYVSVLMERSQSLRSSTPSELSGQKSASLSTASASRDSKVSEISKARSKTKSFMKAMARIEELPQHLEEALNQTTVGVVTDLKGKVQELCTKIQETSDHPQSHIAVERLGRIPDLVMSELRKTIVEIKDFMEDRMQHFVINQSTPSDRYSSSSGNLAEDIAQIPAQVEAVAREVVHAGLADTNNKALAQMKKALAPLALDEHTKAIRDNAVASMPGPLMSLSMNAAVAEVARGTVEGALANVKGQVSCVDNQEVARMIMCSKSEYGFSEAGGRNLGSGHFASSGHGLTALGKRDSLGSGSLGHPELCSRPCMFFPLGQCTKGSSCNYCHEHHPGRATHLDKRHRSLLQTLPVSRTVSLLLRALRSRLRRVSPENLEAATTFLNITEAQCAPLLEDCRMAWEPHVRRLADALQTIFFMLLLLLLLREVSDKLEDEAVNTIIQASSRLRENLSGPGLSD